MPKDRGCERGDDSDVRAAGRQQDVENLFFVLSSRLQVACNNTVLICHIDLMSPIVTSHDVHSSVHWVLSPKSATGDHLAPEQNQALHQGSLAPCKHNNAACYSTTTSLALKMWPTQSHTSISPHTAHLRALFLPRFTRIWSL